MSATASLPGRDAQAPPMLTTPASARPGNTAVHKSSRARPNKSQYGWGNLPTELIHKVLSHVIDDMDMPSSAIDSAFTDLAIPSTIPVAIYRRQWLLRARLVCFGWRRGVETHPFWRSFVEAIAPDSPLLNASARPWFAVAREASANVCIPCTLYQDGSGQGRFDRAVVTARFGILPTCYSHFGAFCINCLRPQSNEAGLMQGERQDFDEEGRLRPAFSVTCSACRVVAINAAISRVFVDCARDGPVHGRGQPLKLTQAYREYAALAMGQSTTMAKAAVEEMFLRDHTRWSEYEPAFWEIQKLFFKWKAVLWFEQHSAISQDEVQRFNNLVYYIWADDEDEGPRHFGLNAFFAQWQQEIDMGVYDGGDAQSDVDRWQRAMRNPRSHDFNRRLCPLLRQTLVDHCIHMWCLDRVNTGLWVMPSDEIRQYLEPGARVHSNIEEMALASTYPEIEPNKREAVVKAFALRRGRFMAPPADPDPDSPYLPTQSMLQQLDARFSELLATRVMTPLHEIIQYQRVLHRDDEVAERICDKFSLGDILGLLTEERVWVEGAMVSHAKFQMRSGLGSTASASPAVNRGGGSERDEYTTHELAIDPLIEVVETAAAPEFGVQEGWSSHPSDDDLDGEVEDDAAAYEGDERVPSESEVSTSPEPEQVEFERPAKRKDVGDHEDEDERPLRRRPGSGQTSTSGESASTALVTPDESPSLLSEVQLADATDSTSTAILTVSDINPSSPTSSPKLGKRKSPADDTLEQPPPRRRQSTPELSDRSRDPDPTPKAEDSVRSPPSEIHTTTAHPSHAARAAVASSVPANRRDARAYTPETSPVPSPPAAKPAGGEDQDEDDMVSLNSDDFNSRTSSQPTDGEWEEASSSVSSALDPVVVPYVPPKWAELGPGASEILERAWITAREVLKECHCTICVRAQRQVVTRMLFEDTQLRIA